MSADPLSRALRRWRAANGAQPAGAPPLTRETAELARRLDDGGCADGRVSAARLDDLTHVVDRLETKLNAVLLAALGTFLSTLVGLAVAYLRAH